MGEKRNIAVRAGQYIDFHRLTQSGIQAMRHCKIVEAELCVVGIHVWSTVGYSLNPATDIWCSSAKTLQPTWTKRVWYTERERSCLRVGWDVQLPEGWRCAGASHTVPYMLRNLVWIPPIISDLHLLFCLSSSNICPYTRGFPFSAVKVICAAWVGGSVKHSKGLEQWSEICWVCLKKLLVSDLPHRGVSAIG